jgi:WD40 repeat protein
MIWNTGDAPVGLFPLRARPKRESAISIDTPFVTLHGHKGTVNDIAFTRTSRILTASDDGTIRIWRLSDGRPEHVLTAHDGPVTSIALRLDDRRLVTASADCTAKVWDMATLQVVATLIPLPEGGYATLFPDGSYKLDGDPRDRMWWTMKLCRFGPGELESHAPQIKRLSADTPILSLR